MKNKTKKNIGIACAILLMILVQAIGITYAKYLITENANGEAEIAKWAFQIVKDGEQTKNIKLVNSVNKESLVNGKIAPGTNGVIDIVLDSTGSEVDLDYELQFANEKNKPSNMTFIAEGQEYKSLSEIKTLNGNMKLADENKTREIAVLWYWDYEKGTTEEEKLANDIQDTQDANIIDQYTFDIVATATQSK